MRQEPGVEAGRLRFSARRAMVGVAVLAILLGGPVAASRGFIRGLYLAEVNRFRDRSGRAASPELKAENDRMVEVYDRPWQSCGGGR